MAINQTGLEAYLEAAITAVGSGDYSTARNQLAMAEIALVGIPDHQIGTRRITYRVQIDGIYERLSFLESRSTTNSKNARVFAKYTRD